jgi:hypothetical protein
VAGTDLGGQLTEAYRAQQLADRAGSIRSLVQLWKAVDPTRLAETIDVFTHAATILLGQAYDTSGALASSYFDLFRRAEGVAGAAPRLAAAARPSTDYLARQIRGSALSGIIDARKAGKSVSIAADQGLVRMVGTFSKLVLAGGNQTILNGVHADRRATGWVRITSGSACAFCKMLSSRGAVYRSDRSATFEPHDHCSCTAEPVYPGSDLDQSGEHKDEFKDAQAWARSTDSLSSGTSNNALNNYRRYLAVGKPTPGSSGGQTTEESGA